MIYQGLPVEIAKSCIYNLNMIYQGLPVEIVNAGLRLLRLADRSLGKREPFYKFDFKGWKLLILPPKPRVSGAPNDAKTESKTRQMAQ